MKTTFSQSRRNLLKNALSVTAGSAIAPWVVNLAAIGDAAAAIGGDDYKALVCVFLYGGNDYANTLVPYDPASYTAYQNLRPAMAYSYASLAGTALAPLQAPVDANGASRQYALAPELAPLMPAFDSGSLAVLLNVGTLIQPTTKAQYLASSVPLPSKLFSHNDQQSEWQSSGAEGTTTGWGGRMEDLLGASNGNPLFACMNVYGNAVFLSGLTSMQYQVTSNGPVALRSLDSLYGSKAAAAAMQAVMTAKSAQLFQSDYASAVATAIGANAKLSQALAAAPTINTPFPSGSSLGNQLKMVARLASVAKTLGVRRQVFFVALNGFDNHDNLLTTHPKLLTELGTALAAFHTATVELGLSSSITTFTASEFGRTLTVNSDGSDHGWGSMHFVLGDAVNGRRYYGTPPVVASNGPDDVGQGRLLPTTSVDQYAATLGRWFGLGDADLLNALPNLINYDVRNLGFV